MSRRMICVLGGAAALMAAASLIPSGWFDDAVDYSKLPPTSAETAQRVHASPLTAARAIAVAEEAVRGKAKSVELEFEGDEVRAVVIVYGEREARRIILNAAGTIVTNEQHSHLPGFLFTGELTTLETGEQIGDIKLGDGASPVDDDVMVKVHYSGYLVDGTRFDSSHTTKEPIAFQLNQVIPGWANGLRTMKVGGTRKIIIPPDQGFGAMGQMPVIPPNATLIFDVELLEILNYAEEPAALPGDAIQGRRVTTESGLAYYDLKVGEGAQPPNRSAVVTVHYSGWLADGTMFDSSIQRGQPATFQLDRVIPGWTEGVSTMKVGGKRKLIIPAALGYGATGAGNGLIPPNAVLIFDVELISIGGQ